MPIAMPSDEQRNLYIYFMWFLNNNRGKIFANDGKYYDFLNSSLCTHEMLMQAITLCKPHYKQYPYILHRDGRVVGSEGGAFYLTSNGYDIISNQPNTSFPALIRIQKPKPKITKEEVISHDIPKKKPEQPWTKEEVVRLLTKEAHIVGRMLGTGYDLLEPLHGEWVYQWIINPSGFKVVVHQAHRNSYKSATLRLAIAIMMILKPLTTIIVFRKSEDAVKECINGVSKILDTPLFHTFVNILYPDIAGKGGFKKTTDTALAIDTNLNISISGEFQLRALGLGSALTGKHAELIITDDIVTTDDRESASERMTTIAKYQEFMNLLSQGKGFNNSRILNIGTPWHEEDAFKLMEKGLKPKSELQEKIENIPFKERTERHLEKLRRLNMRRGLFVYNCYQTGLMTEEDIEWKKKTLNDDVLFAANYMLTLVSDDEKPFPKIDNVGHYTKDFFTESWEVFAHIDAAYEGTDSTSLSIGGFDWDNHTTVVYGKKYSTALDKNYLELAEEMWNCGVQKIYMENNTDKGLMGEKFRELGFDVEGYHESMNKHTKIVSSIRPFWRETGEDMLPCVQFVEETDDEYLAEIYDYKKGVKHDDAPDNLACLLLKSKFGALSVRVT